MDTKIYNCQQNMVQIHAYIDDELDKTQCLELETHIDGCEDCRIVVNTIKKTIQLMQTDGQEIHLSIDARHRLLNQLGIEPANPSSRLKAGGTCPRCHAGRLKYNNLLQLACPHCGLVEAGAST